jgi:tricorn protease
MKPSGQPQKVAVTMTVDARSNNERVLPVTGGARELALSPTGKEVAFIFRGEVFVTSVEGSATKRITNTPEQERGVSFSPDGKSLVYVSERNGRWGAYEMRRTRDEEPYFYASTVL